MTLLQLQRAVTLALGVGESIVRFWLLRFSGPITMERRAQWAHRSSRKVLDSLGIDCRVSGTPPTHGLIVANHLSYLDILILSAATPCFFIAKREIARWPIFGRAARACGTIFLDRASLSSANSVANEMSERLKQPTPLLLFPEGTSTDGSHVLKFHSRLIEPAIKAAVPVTAAAIRYVIEDGTPERELCWFGNALFATHLWKALGTSGFHARVRFGTSQCYPDRRSAAAATHAEVAAMRIQLPLP